MQEKIEQQMQYIQDKCKFVISDKEKTIGYLKQVGIYRLSRYFSIFKPEIDNGKQVDFQRVIDCYVFDRQLRTHCLSLLEIIEVYIKNLLILIIDVDYQNPDVYVKRYSHDRLKFISEKITQICENDKNIAKIFQEQGKLYARTFFNNISFGETRKIFMDLKPSYKKKIAKEIGINFIVLENWLEGMVYLRNLCSHAENIFNRTMTHTLIGDFFDESFGVENDNKFISYLVVLQILKKSLIPSYKWEQGLKEIMQKYGIRTENFAETKTAPLFELSPIKFGSSAWEAFVGILYTNYIKKSNI